MSAPLQRDMIGYGAHPPDPKWPGGARIAINFVMNYEEGSEPSVQDGEGYTEISHTEVGATNPGVKGRDLAGEGMFAYGSRVGFWRLMRLFQERSLALTIYGCALAIERNPAAATAIAASGLGARPLGWYCRYGPSVNTRRLVVEEGGFLYDSDAYDDELPYWTTVGGRPHLVIPYSLVNNDGKFANGVFGSSNDYFEWHKDAFDMLYREGRTQPKMMSVGLHMRVIGHPARAVGLERFLDYVMKFEDVWIARRIDIARHWIKTHPSPGA
jgi:allantoinase